MKAKFFIFAFALFAAANLFGAESPFLGYSYMQRGVLRADGVERVIEAAVSAAKDGAVSLYIESQNIVMAKIRLDKNGNAQFCRGGAAFSDENAEKYILPVFRALLMFDGAYERAEFEKGGRPSKIFAKDFVIFLSGYSAAAGSLPNAMQVCAADFSLSLRLVYSKSGKK